MTNLSIAIVPQWLPNTLNGAQLTMALELLPRTDIVLLIDNEPRL